MNRNNLIIGIIALLVLVIVISGCVTQTTPPTDVLTDENTATLLATVVDTDGKPVENAIVYLGAEGASGKCYTNEEGKCSIPGVYWGSYAAAVFKKGYDRSDFQRGNTKKEDEYFDVQFTLEKKSNPSSVSITGMVIEVITAKGSRSENHYLKIRDETGNEEYIFDGIGVNKGFEEFIDKQVEIIGYKEIGFIGWEHEPVEGIYVESIE